MTMLSWHCVGPKCLLLFLCAGMRSAVIEILIDIVMYMIVATICATSSVTVFTATDSPAILLRLWPVHARNTIAH